MGSPTFIDHFPHINLFSLLKWDISTFSAISYFSQIKLVNLMFANRRDFLLKIELNGKFMFFFLKSIILFAKVLVSGKLLKMGKNTVVKMLLAWD